MKLIGYQKKVEFIIFKGEDEKAVNNEKLGEFSIVDVPTSLVDAEKFIVEFNIDEYGILSVKASNRSTGKCEKILIENYKNIFTEKEIERYQLIVNSDNTSTKRKD